MVKEKYERSTVPYFEIPVDKTWVHEYADENERQLLASNQAFKSGDFPVDSEGKKLDINICYEIGFVPKADVDKWILAKAAISSADRQLTDETSKMTIASLDKWNQDRKKADAATKAGIYSGSTTLSNDANEGLLMLNSGPLLSALFIDTHSYSANAADGNLYNACIKSGLTMHPDIISDKLRSSMWKTSR